MVSEQTCQLLTAYVDGELGPRQQEAVLHLIRQSPEAQTLLQQLQQHAARLKNLPPRKPALDLSRPVLQSIAARRLRPASPRTMSLGLNPAMWAGIAGAAAIMFAIATGAYLYFTSAGPGGAGRSPIAQKQPDSKSDTPRTPQPRPEAPSDDDTTPELIPPPRVEVVQNDEPKEPPRDPGSQPKEPREITTPPRDPKTDQIDKIDLRLPVMLPLRRLDEPDPARQLKEEISKDRGYRLELFCLDSSKAFAKLQAGFQALGVQFVLEPEVQKIVGTRRKIHYVLFAEDLLPDEVFKLLQQLGVNDKKAEAHRTGDGQFGTLVVSRLHELDQKELGKLLGVEPKQLLPVKSKGPLGVDLRKPLPDQTADQLGRALAGQGGAKPGPGQPAARRALVLVHVPERPRATPSKETKLFLDSRTTPRPGSLQIMLVLRCSLD